MIGDAGRLVAPTPEQRAKDAQLAWLIIAGCVVLQLALLVAAWVMLSGPAGRWMQASMERQRLEQERRREALGGAWPVPAPYPAPETGSSGEVSKQGGGENVATDPPGALSTTAGSARPLGSVADWVGPHDYPPDALRAGDEGRVRATLTVGGMGRPVSCEIASSSGHPSLDRATCVALMRRAEFVPPGGTRRWTSPFIRWQLPR